MPFDLQPQSFISLYPHEWTTDTQWLNPYFFATQIQIPIPNKYLECGYKGLFFVEILVD